MIQGDDTQDKSSGVGSKLILLGIIDIIFNLVKFPLTIECFIWQMFFDTTKSIMDKLSTG